MKVVETPLDLYNILKSSYGKKRIGFVPTMGALHEGHLSLVRKCKEQCDITVVSIFVNPSQFAPGEDFEKYPRLFSEDASLLEKGKVDILFHPSVSVIYPKGFSTAVEVEGITNVLCGKSRPSHFRGVTTVVAKLFNIVSPTDAYFGEKDFQQLKVIKKMTEDLNMKINIHGVEIARDKNLLALSSRNAYLSKDEYEDALLLNKAITEAKRIYMEGEVLSCKIKKAVKKILKSGKSLKIDYIALVGEDLRKTKKVDDNTRILLAVYCGKTRLIDNASLKQGILYR